MVGNNVGNSIWEAKLQASQSIAGLKPNAKSPKEEKQRHIVNKYEGPYSPSISFLGL